MSIPRSEVQSMEEYAEGSPTDPSLYIHEPPQKERIERIADRCVGRVLDVGSADGFTSHVIHAAGHEVVACDVSPTRIERVRRLYDIEGIVCDGANLPFDDEEFDTVVLGEILEHLDNPGPVLAEAARVAKERVVISIPLNGWADPTHLWRISVEIIGPKPNPFEPTKGQQAVMTWQKGTCWPRDYFMHDPKWRAQFWDEAHPEMHIQVVDEEPSG